MRAPAQTLDNARKLRKDMSLPEVVLWDCLRAGRLAGLRFRRQHPVGPYVLDFYCPASHLAIEVDGAHHDLPGQMRHDLRRDRWLLERGIRVMRIAATDILDDYALEGVLLLLADIASDGEVPAIHSTRSVVENTSPSYAPSGPPGHLPRERGRIEVAAGLNAGSSPAKRGRGTAEGGGGGNSADDTRGIPPYQEDEKS